VRALAPLYVVVFAGFLGYSLMITVFTPMILTGDEMLPASASSAERTLTLGVLLALYPLGQFLGSPVLGGLSDRFGRRRVLLLSLGASTLMYGAIAVALALESLPLLIAASFAAGLSEANIAIAQSAITDTAPRSERSRLFGYVYLSASLAYVVGPLLGGKLADAAGFDAPYWAVMAILAVVLVVVSVTFRETARPVAAAPGYADAFTNLARVFTDERLRPIYRVNFVLYLALFGFFRVYPMYIVDEFGLDVGEVAEYVAYISVPIVIANLWLVAALSRRFEPRAIAMWAAGAAAALMAFIVVPRSEISLWFTLFPTALAVAICLPACAAMLSLAAGDEEQGRAMGNNQSMQVGAEALSGLAGGALAAALVKLPLLVFAGAAALGVLLLARTGVRAPAHPAPAG
jgi:DHA1 family tetracycline resistance protein-like MFS transporter